MEIKRWVEPEIGKAGSLSELRHGAYNAYCGERNEED
jgi:hypothetical protein